MQDEKEQWLRHRYHESGHTVLAFLAGGIEAVESIEQWWKDEKLEGSAGVNWRVLEAMRVGLGMACAALGGVLAEAKGFVMVRGEKDARLEYRPILVEQVEKYFVLIDARMEPKDGGWSDMEVPVFPRLDPTFATITVDDLRKIPSPAKKEGALEGAFKEAVGYLNNARNWAAVEAIKAAIPERAPFTLPAIQVRAILDRVYR
jgi:hypothetical protein